MKQAIPAGPPFVLRTRILTPLDSGGTRYEPDGFVEVDANGRIAFDNPVGVRV